MAWLMLVVLKVALCLRCFFDHCKIEFSPRCVHKLLVLVWGPVPFEEGCLPSFTWAAVICELAEAQGTRWRWRRWQWKDNRYLEDWHLEPRLPWMWGN